MCTYLKNMANYKHSQLKNKSFEEIQMLFDNTMKWVDSFVPMDTEVVEGSKSQAEGSKKRTREELESDNSKKQKIDENVEAEVDDEAEMKKLMEIVPDDEVAIDAIPLATKSPIIVDWKIIKEGKMGYFQIIRADGSSRRYSSMIRMLQNIDREDLETLWKLVKAKHGNTRPEEAYERVLWGDLKVMFEPDVESEVWKNLQGYNVTVWKLFSSSGVHFVRFQNLHIFMLVEKKYPLTPATITKMLNKKLQTDHWNEMCYQLLKLMTKQVKNPGITAAKSSLFHLLRYIDTRPNGDALRKCILEDPYKLTTITTLSVPATDDSPEVLEVTAVEKLLNMSSKNKEHYQSEKEAIHLLLTGIGDEIYSTGESLNIEDVKTTLFWEFGKFTSYDGESMESYYSRFYKMINEMLFDVLKQYQKKVNEIRAERIAKNTNPLELVVAAQQYPDLYYQAPKSYKSYAPPSKQSSSTRSNASTKYKGK
ncbi:hypothetical protein Tco_0967715 [Tanacetum coccineum]